MAAPALPGTPPAQSLIEELRQQNELLRQQNEFLLGRSLERGADVEDNKRKWNALDKEAAAMNEKAEYDKWWLLKRTKTHLPEWGEVCAQVLPAAYAWRTERSWAAPWQDQHNPWPDGGEEDSRRPVPKEIVPAKVKPKEMLKRTWMLLSGKIQDGIYDPSQKAYDDYVGHYCPSIFAPPIFGARRRR